MTLYAHNTARSGPAQDVPVIVDRDPVDNPWSLTEVAAEWHEASDDEYNAYLDYWRPDIDPGEDDGPDPDDYNDMMKDLARELADD